MVKQDESTAQAKIESLTKNLLECYEELELVYRVSRGLMSPVDIQKISDFILNEAMEIFEADIGWIFLAQSKDFPFESVRRNVDEQTINLINSFSVKDLIRRKKSKLYVKE